MTNDLISRVYQHKNNLADGFTKKYNIHMLVYYEITNDVLTAITRENQIKKWKRLWKINLIESISQNWEDLYEKIL